MAADVLRGHGCGHSQHAHAEDEVRAEGIRTLGWVPHFLCATLFVGIPPPSPEVCFVATRKLRASVHSRLLCTHATVPIHIRTTPRARAYADGDACRAVHVSIQHRAAARRCPAAPAPRGQRFTLPSLETASPVLDGSSTVLYHRRSTYTMAVVVPTEYAALESARGS